jgi:Protein of unknown function (DUF1631)
MHKKELDMSTAYAAPSAQEEVGIPIDSRKRFTMLEECREQIVTKLSAVVLDALDKMSGELTDQALKKVKREEQQALLEAVSIIRQHKEDIQIKFKRSFSDVFERRMFNKPENSNLPGAEGGELSLVDDSIIKDQITVHRLVNRAKSRLDPDEVLGIRARLAALVERDWFEEDQHPVSPEVIFEALKCALNEVTPLAEVRTALLDAFEPYVSANLNAVYSGVNIRLKTGKILPKIRPRVQTIGRSAGASRKESALESSKNTPGSPEMMSVPAEYANALADIGWQGAGGIDGGQSMSVPAAAEMFERLAHQIASGQTSARFQAAKLLADPTMFGVADLPLPAAQPPLLGALASLQAESQNQVPLSAQLLGELSSEARDKGTPLDQVTVEIVSLIFDYIYADRRLADPVKQQLLRLQVVAIKAALLDRSFFARRQHPLRHLIDIITETACDPEMDASSESPLVLEINTIVSDLISGFDRDLAIFDQARDRLGHFVRSEQERRASEMAEQDRDSEREEAFLCAREESLAEINLRIDGSTPDFVREFAQKWWVDAMAHAQLSVAPEGLDLERALAVCEQLIWSVTPKGAEDVARLAGMLPKLIDGLKKGLAPTAIEQETRETFFNEWFKWTTNLLTTAKAQSNQNAEVRRKSSVRMRSDGTIHFDSKALASAVVPATPVNEGFDMPLDPLANIVKSSLIDLDQENAEAMRVKVSWVSPSRKLFVLRRYPDFTQSVSREEFTTMIKDGKAKLAPAGTALDRAIETLSAQ